MARSRGPFPYMGSKHKLVPYLPVPPSGVAQIIEPFAGSLAYSIYHNPETIQAADANPLMRSLLEYLASEATAWGLALLQDKKPPEKIGLRDLGLSVPETTLLRLSCSGLYLGQLSSWVAYPQHRVNFEHLVALLPRYRKLQFPIQDDFRKVTTTSSSMLFVDPPYKGTQGWYKSSSRNHGGLDAEALTQWLLSQTCPVLLTYGTGAPQTFPGFQWNKIEATSHGVPKRNGGRRLREEWFATLNWPGDIRYPESHHDPVTLVTI